VLGSEFKNNVKTKLKILAAVVVTSLFGASQSFAGLGVTLYTHSDGQPTGYRDPNSYGGEFAAVLTGSQTYGNKVINNSYITQHYSSKALTTVNGQTAFETFCIEVNESFSPGTSYNAQVSTTVIPGGPLNYVTLGVSYLYSQFAQGELSGYNYTAGSGRELSADELQDAIWYLQGEINTSGKVTVSGAAISSVNNSTYTFSSSDPFLVLAEDVLYGSVCANALTKVESNGNGADSVLALDLSSISNGCTVYNQDQLVYCPVPEAATLAAGVVLLVPLGFSTIRRLRKGQKI
jgi:hypothetical protein